MASGVFTVPVPGIYYFQLSTLKDTSASSLGMVLEVNDFYVPIAETVQPSITGSYDAVSLTSSFRLKSNDRVVLVYWDSGVIYDNANHHTHFTGWSVEKEL